MQAQEYLALKFIILNQIVIICVNTDMIPSFVSSFLNAVNEAAVL